MKPIFTYKNPVYCKNIDAIRDCQILKHKDIYYLTGTCPPFWPGQGENPGIKLYSSSDLVNWEFENYLLTRDQFDVDNWSRDRFWAPEIHYINNKFYLIYTCWNEKNRFPRSCGMAVSDSITGPFKILSTDKPLVERGWDLTLFTDDKDVFCYWTDGFHIYGQKIDLENYQLIKSPFVCIRNENAKWDSIGIEGPWLIKRDGLYYMFYSSWTRGYEIGYATANSPKGLWTKAANNPFFGAQNKDVCKMNRLPFSGNPKSPFIGIGHNAVFTGPDNRDWIVCHYQEKDKPESLGFDPITISNGMIISDGPTWTEQRIQI